MQTNQLSADDEGKDREVQVQHTSPATQFLAVEALRRAGSLLFDARGDQFASKGTDDVISET